MLRITTADGKQVEVTQEIRTMSQLVEQALMDNAAEEADINVNDNEREIKKLVEYCQHHDFKKTQVDIKHPLKSKDPQVWCNDDWERDWVHKMDMDERSHLLVAANNLQVDPLLELCAASIAAEFKNTDFEKLKGNYGLNDATYTPEDDDKLIIQYPWLHGEAERKVEELIKKRRAEGLNMN